MEINGELVNEEVRYADLGLSQALMPVSYTHLEGKTLAEAEFSSAGQ